MRVGPFGQAQLAVAQHHIRRVVDANMPVGIDVVSRVQQFPESLVANILLQRFLWADDECPASAARIGRKRERLDIAVVDKIEHTFGRRISQLNHPVAHLVVTHAVLLCQRAANGLQPIPHVPACRVFTVQFLLQPFAKVRLRHLKALAPHMRLPLHPFHRAAFLFLNVYALPPDDFHDVAVVQLLQLEKQPVFDIVKALMHDRTIAVEFARGVQNDGVCLHAHGDRGKLRSLNILTDQHFARVKEQDACRPVAPVQRQADDLQSQPLSQHSGSQICGIVQCLRSDAENDVFRFFFDVLPMKDRNEVFVQSDSVPVFLITVDTEVTVLHLNAAFHADAHIRPVSLCDAL